MSNIPNWLSAGRAAAAPLLVALFWLPQWSTVSLRAAGIAAASLFIVAAATDFFDGYWARKYSKQTRLGAFLDPAADKLLVVTSLLLLLEAERAAGGACLLIIGREVLISALREWAARDGFIDAVQVVSSGKWKAGVQMTAIPCLFAADMEFLPLIAEAGKILLWIAALLATWSMVIYARAAWRAQPDADN